MTSKVITQQRGVALQQRTELKEKIDSVDDLTELQQVCSRLNPAGLGGATLRAIAKRIRRFRPENAIRVSCLGNVTLHPLPEYLEAAALCSGINVIARAGGFDQYVQELVDPESDLRNFDPQFVILALELRQLDADVFFSCSAMPFDRLNQRRKDLLDRIGGIVETALKCTEANCVLLNFPVPANFRLGIADVKHRSSEYAFYAQLNFDLVEMFRAQERVQIVDVERLSAGFGKFRAFDIRMYYLAKMPWHEDFVPTLADELVRHIEAATGHTRKCLALDLDNTLWGGVLGEDGPHGVKVGTGDAVSEAFFDFQMRIRGLRDRGIILAICSKNNPGDVDELFKLRTDMPLQRDDFVVVCAGWETKNIGLARIARTLNIGTDSLLFVDNNPVEIGLINQTMPEVDTLLLPADPAAYCRALDGIHGLDKASISSDDSRKSAQYQEQARREDKRLQFTDLTSFLTSLETHISVWYAEERDVRRIHELFTKTNQFNATTKRYTIGDIETFMASDKYDLIVFSAKDTYGDLATIGVCLIVKQNRGDVTIDSFVMSCRVIGRGIETVIMNQLKARYFGRNALCCIEATYIPTKKNEPIRSFFQEQGFAACNPSISGEIRYRLRDCDSSELACDWIAIDKRIDM